MSALVCTKCNTSFKTQAGLTKHNKRKTPCNYKKQRIPLALKKAVWNRDFPNATDGNCYLCKRVLYHDDFHTAHIIAEANGGLTNIDNLRVTCKSCNLSCGTKNLNEFKETTTSKIESKIESNKPVTVKNTGGYTIETYADGLVKSINNITKQYAYLKF